MESNHLGLEGGHVPTRGQGAYVATVEIVNERFHIQPGMPLPVQYTEPWVLKFLREKYGADAIKWQRSDGSAVPVAQQGASDAMARLGAQVESLLDRVKDLESQLAEKQLGGASAVKRRGRPPRVQPSESLAGEDKDNVET